MPFCENCGQEVSDSSRFCSNCGEGIVSSKKSKQRSLKVVEDSMGSQQINVENIWWVKVIKFFFKVITDTLLSVLIGAPLSYLIQPSIIRDYYSIHYYLVEWTKVFSPSRLPFEEITNSSDDISVYLWTFLLTLLAVSGIISFFPPVLKRLFKNG